MLPTSFPGHNCVFKKPSSMTDEQCMDLPVFKGADADGFPIIISCWRLSKEDLDEVAKTGVVYLQIASNGMPPVSIFTENPFQ